MASDFAAAIGHTVSKSWSWWWEGKSAGDELSRGGLTVLVVIFTILWFFWIITKSRKEVLPPGPRGLPIVGNLPFIDPEMHTYFTKLANIYGPIFKLRLGRKLCVVIGSAELAKEVMKDQDATFANRDVPVSAKVITYGGSDIVFAPYGRHWRTARLICVRELLSKTSLDLLYTLRRNEIRRTVKSIYSKNDTPINIGEQILKTMLNVITTMLWSGRDKDDDDEENSTILSTGSEFRLMVSEIIELLGKPNISDFFPVLARLDVQGIEWRMKQLLSSADQFFDPILEQRMRINQVDKHNDVLQTLLKIKDQGNSKTPFTMTNLKALLMDLVIGGTDTSLVVEWAMAELMKNPEIMRNAQEELEVVVGRNNMVEESHLPKLKYVGAVVKETLRLHPGVPLLVSRCPSSSCKVGGYTIPKGAQVFVNAFAIQRNPRNWDNPMEFQPDRFLNCTDSTSKYEYKGTDFRYIPLGSGRRCCVGIPLVERMVPYVLASLLHSFE